nr:LuxR C-terminal-related transcriptional regulator [Duganella sp. SG902]
MIISQRERDIRTAISAGVHGYLPQRCAAESIATKLDIGVGTVKTHVKSLFNKLGATARTHAVVLATQRGMVA